MSVHKSATESMLATSINPSSWNIGAPSTANKSQRAAWSAASFQSHGQFCPILEVRTSCSLQTSETESCISEFPRHFHFECVRNGKAV
eukprot:3601941-Amphidinium_carterae.1